MWLSGYSYLYMMLSFDSLRTHESESGMAVMTAEIIYRVFLPTIGVSAMSVWLLQKALANFFSHHCVVDGLYLIVCTGLHHLALPDD